MTETLKYQGGDTGSPGDGVAPSDADTERERRDLVSQIEARIREADDYLKTWESEVDELAKTPDGTGRDGAQRWLYGKEKEFFAWYTENILPLREASPELGKIWAHGTTTETLFGASLRAMGQRGIVKQGMAPKADFGIFERHGQNASGGGGWWSGGPSSRKVRSTRCWVIASNRATEEIKKSKPVPDFTIVFPDPRTYKWYLGQLRDYTAGGGTTYPHQAMRLDQLQEYLQAHEGRLSDEIEGGK